MRQTIACEECVPYWRTVAKDPRVAADGESVTVVTGKALRNYRCDDCNAELERGSVCYAVGVIGKGQNPRTGWESLHIDVARTAEEPAE